MNKRITFELRRGLSKKLDELCKRDKLGYSEYIRNLIAEEYNRTFVKTGITINATDTDIDANMIISILEKIEQNTRKEQ